MTRSKVERWLALSGLLLIIAVAVPARSVSGPGARLAGPVAAAMIPAAAADSDGLNSLNRYRLALLEMKGHLAVARELLQTLKPGAQYHLREPMERIFRRIEPELQSRNAPLNSEILAPLQRVPETTPDIALNLLDSVASAIDGSYAQSGAVDSDSVLSLSQALLSNAVAQYRDSVKDNTVTDVPGYQTGYGFANQAEALVRHATRLRSKPGYDRLLDDIVLIRQSWPGVEPPPIVFDPATLSTRLDETVAIMDQMR